MFFTFDVQPGSTTLSFTSDVVRGAHVPTDVILRYVLDDEVPGFMDADTTVRMDGVTVFLPSGIDKRLIKFGTWKSVVRDPFSKE